MIYVSGLIVPIRDSLEIYLPISPVGCIASLLRSLDSEMHKCANPSATLGTRDISIP